MPSARIDDHFIIGAPFARAINPISLRSERFEKEFVGVTPHPLFARLEGTNQRMFRRVVVLRRVLVRRRVAAADVTASQTQAQMQPTASAAQAIFASSCAGRDFLNLI